MTWYDWDTEKAASNIVDHDGITFEEGITALLDEYVYYEGQRYYEGELREHSIGLSATGLLLFVGYTVTYEDDDEIVQIITVRQAGRQERARYYENHP